MIPQSHLQEGFLLYPHSCANPVSTSAPSILGDKCINNSEEEEPQAVSYGGNGDSIPSDNSSLCQVDMKLSRRVMDAGIQSGKNLSSN